LALTLILLLLLLLLGWFGALDILFEIADTLDSVEIHAAATRAAECANFCALNVS